MGRDTRRRRRHAQRFPGHPHQLHDDARGSGPGHHQGPGVGAFGRRGAPGSRVEDNEGKAEVTSLRGAVTFEGVGHTYFEGAGPAREEGRPAVRDFTPAVAPGETIALVGASGAGKSTVLNLVIGFIRPTSGRLLLDGTDMNTLDLRTYRPLVSVVPQESILFDGTVRENVAYGMDDAGDATVRVALRDANALEFVGRLPQGLDTVIGEHGARLSGGGGGAAAPRHRAGADPRSPGTRPRRGHLRAGHALRGPRPAGTGPAAARAHHVRRGAPAVHDPGRGPHRRDAGRGHPGDRRARGAAAARRRVHGAAQRPARLILAGSH